MKQTSRVDATAVDDDGLPVGPATEVKQDVGNTSLDNIDDKIGEVQTTPTANTVLGRLKDLLTGIVIAAGTNILGKIRIWNSDDTDNSLTTGGQTGQKVMEVGRIPLDAATDTVTAELSAVDNAVLDTIAAKDFATSAKQDTLLTELQLKADLTETQPVKEIGLAGTGTTGTLALTSANTWYACPSTAPSNPYVLIATVENAAGTVRFTLEGSAPGTAPSVTYGNLAPGQLMIRLAASQKIYFGSSTAGDDVNWTCKEIV